jgi:RNA methyltransferase, TrmH family
MIAREISSLQHPIVKYLVKLRDDRAFRKAEKSVLIMGNKQVGESAGRFPLKMLLKLPEASVSFQADEVFVVSEQILKKITGLEKPEPIAAVIAMPDAAPLAGKKKVLALDGIADPGNLGSLLRSALALGWEGVFITSSSCDPFNPKAVRAARGATFLLPLYCGSEEELSELIAQGFQLVVADLDGEELSHLPAFDQPLMLLLGSESHGPRYQGEALRVTIPMDKEVESLNVASAGAILMYALHPKSHARR